MLSYVYVSEIVFLHGLLTVIFFFIFQYQGALQEEEGTSLP